MGMDSRRDTSNRRCFIEQQFYCSKFIDCDMRGSFREGQSIFLIRYLLLCFIPPSKNHYDLCAFWTALVSLSLQTTSRVGV